MFGKKATFLFPYYYTSNLHLEIMCLDTKILNKSCFFDYFNYFFDVKIKKESYYEFNHKLDN